MGPAILPFPVAMAAPSTPGAASRAPSTVGGVSQASLASSPATEASLTYSTSSACDKQKAVKACAAGFFVCGKCERTLELKEQSGRRFTCQKCNSAYKALTDKWKSAPKLKEWWQSLGPTQVKQWYVKQLDLPTRTKRKWSELGYEETSVKGAVSTEAEVEEFETWDSFRDRGRAAGLKACKVRHAIVCRTFGRPSGKIGQSGRPENA